MKTVKDILESKPKDVWSIGPKASVVEALRLMAEKEIGAIMVIDDAGAVCGILSERDYARKIALLGRHSSTTSVEEIMTPGEKMYKVAPSSTLEECMLLMIAKHIRHLPVYEKEKLAGFISINDVMRMIISSKDYLIEHLNSYASLESKTRRTEFPGEHV